MVLQSRYKKHVVPLQHAVHARTFPVVTHAGPTAPRHIAPPTQLPSGACHFRSAQQKQ